MNLVNDYLEREGISQTHCQHSSSHGAITAFGAINTVVAGTLTFLKGSGLPSRLKYYQNEWKKVREYIEQRERDFSRPNCQLDLYSVVATVETMYEEVKLDTEANAPDRYAGVGNRRTMATTSPFEYPKRELVSDRMRSLETGFQQLRGSEEELGQRGHDFEAGLGSREKDLDPGLGDRIHRAATRLSDMAHEGQSGLEKKMRELDHVGKSLKNLASDVAHKAKEAKDNAEVHGRRMTDQSQGAEKLGTGETS